MAEKEVRMTEKPEPDDAVEHLWHTYLTTGEIEQERRMRRLFRLLPGYPRCNNCYAPFQGTGNIVTKYIFGKHPSNLNPQLCNICEQFARQYQGGAEVELSLLFADVRGSTTLAEGMSPTEFSKLVNRFYRAATEVMVKTDALIDKIIGDQIAGMYVPGFAGPEHARRAIEAAQLILRNTGHYRAEGPWIPLGVGVHTGTAFVGSVGLKGGTSDITVLGDLPNTAARLSSSAGQGEILISTTAYEAAGLQTEQLEQRIIELKGKSEPVVTYVLSDDSRLNNREV